MSSDEGEEDISSDGKLDTILKELVSFKRFVVKKFEETKEANAKILASIDILNKEVNSLKRENARQKAEIAVQAKRIDSLEKQVLENSVHIQNIPFSKDEVVTDIVYNIASKLHIKLTTSSIVKVYRKKPKVNGRPGDIFVKFNTAATHDSFLSEAKKIKLSLSDVGFKGENSRIYINHELSQSGKLLFYEARKLQKQKNWKFVWEKGGSIYIRKSEGSDAVNILSIDQMLSL